MHGLQCGNEDIVLLENIANGERIYCNWKGGVCEREGCVMIGGGGRSRSEGGLCRMSVVKGGGRMIMKMRLIPGSGRDYEVVESNAEFFEENLLGQIQVVYNGQVFAFYCDKEEEKEGKGLCAMMKVEIEEEYGFISKDCEIVIDYVKEEEEMLNNKGKDGEIVRKGLRVEFNRRKGMVKIPQVSDCNRRNCSEYICLISISEEETDMLWRLSDYSLITKAYSAGGNYDSKFPYMKSFWLLITINENELIDRIILPSYVTISTCIFHHDTIDLLLYQKENIIKSSQEYLTQLSSNLSLEYFIFKDNTSISPLAISSFLKEELGKAGVLVFTCDFIYLLIISNCKVAMRFTLNNKAALASAIIPKNTTAIPIIIHKEDISLIDHIPIKSSHELTVVYSYTTLSKANRNLYINSQVKIPQKFKVLNRRILLENSADVIKHIEQYYYGRDYRNSSLVLLPKVFNAYSLCKVILDKVLYLDIHYEYLDLNLFQYDSHAKDIKEYFKQLSSCSSSIDSLTKKLVIIKGIERLLCTNSQEMEGSRTNYHHNDTIKLVGYYLSKYLSKVKERGNSYIVLVSNGNECLTNHQELSIDFIKSNIDIIQFKIGNITPMQLKSLKDFSYDDTDTDAIPHNLIIEDLINIDMTKASIRTYTPLNSEGGQSHKDNPITFTHICNMEQAKTDIKDTISLSLKSNHLFTQGKMPIQLSTGILLIGPSGCGKSFLASAIHSEFSITFYPIKCTDILSKFIGQSEAMIRQYFAKAKETRPSVLFFDELEALTPIRGSGSTGVTDRIVNQMLTYLDGIESRQDVFVIGASAHPNMIDPAMLRPGRLDKVILCDYPTKEERRTMLHFAIDQLKCNKEIKEETIEGIASKSPYYTPADLDCIVYSAYVIAVKESVARKEALIVKDGHLNDSFKDFKKSMDKEEIEYYENWKDKRKEIWRNVGVKSTFI